MFCIIYTYTYARDFDQCDKHCQLIIIGMEHAWFCISYKLHLPCDVVIYLKYFF